MNIFDRKENLKLKRIIHLSTSKSLSVNPFTIELQLTFPFSAVANTPEEYFYSINKEDVAYYFPMIRNYSLSYFDAISREISYGTDTDSLFTITYAASNPLAHRQVREIRDEIGRISYEYIR